MKRLNKFCQDRNIYIQTYYYTKKTQKIYQLSLNSLLCGRIDFCKFFHCAFVWAETIEGSEFWSDISVEWSIYCKQNNIKKINEGI